MVPPLPLPLPERDSAAGIRRYLRSDSPQSVSFDPSKYALIGVNGWPGASTGGAATVAAVALGSCTGGMREIQLSSATISGVTKATLSGFGNVATLPATNATAALTADHRAGSEADLLVRPPLSGGRRRWGG